ncbi:hypothetical protein KP509_14G060100 [Ceratopteris richardii]|uniref:Vacuolar protein sorting-associated protein 29 n=1 Tax=Ceratopteris richardii TaxID=49495 RepID=A0A8T2TAM5_CERRI|nr:hypothetical protein KP509_14G060100 [Ceratopteris richardii]
MEVALAEGDHERASFLLSLISDTHGLLDSAIINVINTAAPHVVLHAGDVGDKNKKRRLSAVEIVGKLQESTLLKRVFAVAGNVDESSPELPSYQVVTVGKIRILILHICGYPPKIPHEVQQLMDSTLPQIVIFGHSHIPGVQWHNNILFVNPGSAGPRRFKLPRCMALLRLHFTGIVDLEFIPVGTSPQDTKNLPASTSWCLNSTS